MCCEDKAATLLLHRPCPEAAVRNWTLDADRDTAAAAGTPSPVHRPRHTGVHATACVKHDLHQAICRRQTPAPEEELPVKDDSEYSEELENNLKGNNGIARLLLSRGANVDVESSEGTPLHVSAERGRFDMMEILLEHHADAIMLDPADATLYSNRSFCHLKIGGARDALVDANACINLQPDWPKGYYRKGAALMSLKEYKEARDAFMDGLKLDPSNLDIQNAYWEADEAMIKKHSTGQSVRQAI